MNIAQPVEQTVRISDFIPPVSCPEFPKKTVNIKDYGAIPDGTTLNTQAIAQAIDACAHAGGGTVLIPAGLWLTGPIRLKSRVRLHVEKHALVAFSPDYTHYPLRLVECRGIRKVVVTALISGENLENIAITGEGIFDGSGHAWRFVKKWKMTDLQWNALVASGGVVDTQRREIAWWPSQQALNGRDIYPTLVQQPDIDLGEYEAVHEFLRPELVRLIECKQVLIDGPTFQNSPFWNLHPWLCEDVTIRNIHVRNPWYAQNGDGLDLDSCRNVLVSTATFDVGDDAICLKSGKDEEGRKLNTPTENVIVQDCTVYHGHGGFVIGSEMSGNVRNIKVSRCTFMGTDIGLRFKSVRGRGGVVEQVAIDDITMINIEKDAILFDLYYETPVDNATSPASVPIAEETPQIRDITITHVICRGAERALLLRGLPEMPLRNIRFEHLHLIAEKGITRVNTENIAFHDVLIEDPLGNTILCS